MASAAHADGIYDKYFAKAGGGKPCYARVYDSAHLKAHPRQKVTDMEVDFDTKEGDSDRPNSEKYFEIGVGFRLKSKPKEWVGAAAYCKTTAGFFDCYLDGGGGTFRLTPQSSALKFDVVEGADESGALAVDNGDDFPVFGAPGSDDRAFILPPADRKVCDAMNK
jgi:hypothetical protein